MYEPGKKYEYSGGGITITQLMLTNITGRDYASFMQEEVLKPLGMNHSSYQQPSSDTSELATGYYTNGTSVKGKYHVYPEQAAAGLWTTPSDLARYIIDCQLNKDTLKINFCGKDLCIRQNSDMENIYKIYFSDFEHFSVTEVPDADFRTIRDAKGNIEALELKQRGNTIRLPKLK